MHIRHACLTLAALCLVAPSASAQVTEVTAPATTVNVTAAKDFATAAFQDPWDMKQNTDLGWHIWSNDLPATGLGSVAFNQPATANAQNGTDFLHMVSTNASPNIALLESSNRFGAKLGKTGDMFAIDAATYTMLSYRLCATGGGTMTRKTGGFTSADLNSTAYVVYATNDSDLGVGALGPIATFAGCQIYTVDLTAVGKLDVGAGVKQWSGIMRYLELDPTHLSGVTMDLDWVRLVQPLGNQTISWSGGGAGDIYLDNNNVSSDGTLGMLSKNDGQQPLTRLALGVSSPYTFDFSALSPGTYYVMVCPTGVAEGSASCRYSPGRFDVNGIPTLTVTAPSEEGSADDFATVQLNNAWDFDALTDIDFSQNIVLPMTIDTAFPVQRPDGTDLGNVRVLKGTPTSANAGDPYFYTLFFAGTGRGVSKKIDASRYRILTVDMGLPGARDINGGSIARIVWKTTTETAENVSQDIIINHRAGVNILDRINVDMKKLLIETDATSGAGAGSHGTAGWNGLIENFRLDPHEFTPVTQFWVKQIKLAALETVGSSNTYTIKWTATDTFDTSNATGAKVSVFYETVNASGDPTGSRTAISTCTSITASAGQCTWNTNTVPTASYFLFFSITDGVNTNTVYSKYPIVVDPAAGVKPRMVLDRALLNFGGHNTNGTSVTVTPGQQVRLSIVGSGTVSWTATKAGTEPTLFSVTPTSGTGPAILTISVPPNTALPNNLVGNLGTVVVSSSQAENSPQAITVYLAMTGTTAAPFGGFDTPAEGDTIQGSIAVTGWVLDDIGVTKLEIYRDANSADPPGAIVNAKVFIGTATLVDGARTDIVSAFPNSPANYNAGWGYLMLTRGLIWDGKGPFKLYAQATDVDGHTVILGSKTVTVNNGSSNPNAQKPFGSIDTPDQGGTATGNYPNTGWVLSPGTTIPASGVRVAVDGVFLTNTFSMSDRTDISNGFPGFNTTGSGRGSFIDTTQFTDGVHTIGWFVTDALGRSDGIGSRFFKTSNSSLIATTVEGQTALASSATAFPRLGENVPALLTRRDVRVGQMGRIAVNAGGAEPHTTYAAYRVVDGRLRQLPLGSAFDTRNGDFFWQPAPGYLGDYDFVFVKSRYGMDIAQVSVRVTVGNPE